MRGLRAEENMGLKVPESTNVDARELAKFEALADRWWDPTGEFKALHDLNPVRVDFIDARAPLRARRVVDVGCGGGILSEAMAHRGARVTGIDAAASVLEVARRHQADSSLEVDYVHITTEELARRESGSYDTVACMELLEHVPDPVSLVRACASLTRVGGDVFFSTINRNPKAWAYAVLGAEYVLGLIPKGTHDYQNFIRPSELAGWARQAGLELKELKGMTYNPLTGEARLGSNVQVNYLAWLTRSR